MSSNGGGQQPVERLPKEMFLPIANVNRVMKSAIPSHVKVSKDAKETLQECITEFVLFVTSEASERVARDHRSTVTQADLLKAMDKLAFFPYIQPMTKFAAVLKEKRKSKKKKIQSRNSRCRSYQNR